MKARIFIARGGNRCIHADVRRHERRISVARWILFVSEGPMLDSAQDSTDSDTLAIKDVSEVSI